MCLTSGSQSTNKQKIIEIESNECLTFLDVKKKNVRKYEKKLSEITQALLHNNGNDGLAMDVAMSNWIIRDFSSCLSVR